MNNYTITEDKTGYNEIHYKKFNSLKDCKKWIKNNLDNKKYPLRKSYFYTNKHLLQSILEAIKEKTKSGLNNYYNKNYNSLYK